MAVGDILAEGRLGTPVAAYASRMHSGGSDRPWRMDAELGGGVVFDLLVHDSIYSIGIWGLPRAW